MCSVALRKESVDRNLSYEMPSQEVFVALRKESVDRNVFGFGAKLVHSVALRKESVDRNMLFLLSPVAVGCRSPQGERG